jgi:hypothetical protein
MVMFHSYVNVYQRVIMIEHEQKIGLFSRVDNDGEN